MGLSRTVSEIDGDFSRKSQNVPTPVYFAPSLEGFPLEFGTGAGSQRTRMMGLPGHQEVNDIFSRLDTIHQRDRRTDGWTPGDSKDRAYA